MENEHNALGGNTGKQLASYVNRVQRLEEEIGALNDDKRDIYAEAKACGFDKKTLRKIVMHLKKDKHEADEEEALMDLYLSAYYNAVQTKQKEEEVDPLA